MYIRLDTKWYTSIYFLLYWEAAGVKNKIYFCFRLVPVLIAFQINLENFMLSQDLFNRNHFIAGKFLLRNHC